jgi:allantoinase
VIAEGKISEVFPVKHADAEDMGNSIIMPGVIDAHVHVNEPGRTEWEGFETATQAAAAGGTTTLVDMPLNASPVTTSAAALKLKLEASKDKLNINVGFYGGLIPGNSGDIREIAKSGVLGIKCFLTHSGIDEFPNVSEQDLRIAMPVLAEFDIPLLVHCELSEEANEFETGAAEGEYLAYLQSRPRSWENKAVKLMIDLSTEFNCAVHIVHVSSSECIEMIASAKAAGLKVTAETCPHYIYFNAETIPDKKSIFKCAPPIREKENNSLLKAALKDGVLDFLATDHSPAPPELKEITTGNLQNAWGGISSLQFLLTSSFTALEHSMPFETFIPLLTEHPANFLKVDDNKGYLRPGYDADIVIWKPDVSQMVSEEAILHKHKATPYLHEKFSATVVETIVNGTTVYSDNKITTKNAGVWLLRK